MISDEAMMTIHQAARTDRLWAVIRRGSSLAWLLEAGTVEEVNAEALSLWEELPLAAYPVLGVLRPPKGKDEMKCLYCGSPASKCHCEASRTMERESVAALQASARIEALMDALENLLSEESASYCEYCWQHAPKDADSGELIGVVEHFRDCPAENARALLSRLGRLS